MNIAGIMNHQHKITHYSRRVHTNRNRASFVAQQRSIADYGFTFGIDIPEDVGITQKCEEYRPFLSILSRSQEESVKSVITDHQLLLRHHLTSSLLSHLIRVDGILSVLKLLSLLMLLLHLLHSLGCGSGVDLKYQYQSVI